MKLHRLSIVFSLFVVSLLVNTELIQPVWSQNTSDNPSSESIPSLKGRFADKFDIGTAVSPHQLQGDLKPFIVSQFNSITAENCMKPEAIFRRDGKYNFSQADQLVEFAADNGMKVRGHTLVWHSQTPPSFFTDENNNPLDKDALYARMDEYITAVLTHFRGKVYCWDVVNEALADGGPDVYRTRSPWFSVCGKDFIAHAFRTAHKVDPTIKLFYNDYNLIWPAKRERALKMLRELKADGVPIHGVGMQAHWDIESFSPVELQNSITAFAELGLEVQITEMDMTTYTKYHGPVDQARNEALNEHICTPEIEAKQAEKYRQVFEVLLKNSDIITSVTTWGVNDRYTWLNNFPRRGRTDHPMLFDRQCQPKKAFHEVIRLTNAPEETTNR